MTVLAETLIVGLVAYRIWRIIGVDSITESFRDWLFDYSEWIHGMVVCPWCLGFWITLPVALAAVMLGVASLPLVWLWLAAAVVVGWLGEVI